MFTHWIAKDRSHFCADRTEDWSDRADEQADQGLRLAKIPHLSRVVRKPTFWFRTRSDTNQLVQLQQMARGLKFRNQKVEGWYYLCSENKVADQLRGYREADLRLCFRICKTLVFT